MISRQARARTIRHARNTSPYNESRPSGHRHVRRSGFSEQARDDLPGRTLVTLTLTLTSVSDDDLGAELTVAWDVEPGREVLPETRLPQVMATGWDEPQVLEAFLAAIRLNTAASAANRTLQALPVVPQR